MTTAKSKKKMTDEAPTVPATEVIMAYKGFDKDLACRGHQFEVGETYTVSGKISACHNGFHACTNPWDVLGYYELLDGECNFNRFAEVEQSGAIDHHSQDSKIASAEITIKAELAIPKFIGKLVDWIVDATKPGKVKKPEGAATETLNDNGGDSAQIGSSGDSAQIGSSGDSAQIGSSGDSARIGSSGDSAQIGSSGDSARIKTEGKDAVVASAGTNARVKGAVGTWVSVAEFDRNGKCVGFASGKIGDDGIPADTWLIAKNGKLVTEDA